jgi:hypothetical protein
MVVIKLVRKMITSAICQVTTAEINQPLKKLSMKYNRAENTN